MSRLRIAHAPIAAAPAARTLADKAAWVESHSKPHAAALHLVTDCAIAAITAHELRRAKRRKRPA